MSDRPSSYAHFDQPRASASPPVRMIEMGAVIHGRLRSPAATLRRSFGAKSLQSATTLAPFAAIQRLIACRTVSGIGVPHSGHTPLEFP